MPKLSVLVIAFNGPRLLERCLNSLAAQTVQQDVEVLVVGAFDAVTSEAPPLALRFPRAQWLRVPPGSTVPQMRYLGMVRSQGDIVALLEDDCVAPPTWYEELLNAHRAPWLAIGGAVEPGAYAKALDWGVYFCEYSAFMQPVPDGAASALPGTNVSYKRTLLTGLLKQMADTAPAGFYEAFVHQTLRQTGVRLEANPALVVYNANSWSLKKVMADRFHHGRGFAALRVVDRPAWRRLPFLALAVVLPLLQVARLTSRALSRGRHRERFAQAFPAIVLLSTSWAVGEFMGYLLGPGASLDRWC